MRLAGIWRYPVKSFQGEPLATAQLDATGVVGDRRWAVADRTTGRVLSAKRDGRLLLATARTADPVTLDLPGEPSIAGPGPEADRALTAWLGRTVQLIEADEHVPTFERQADDTDDRSPTALWEGRPGRFVDSSPIHLLTTGSLIAAAAARPDLDWSVQRFRPNLLVDCGTANRVEDHWVGRRVAVGSAELLISRPCRRCVMTTRPQPGGIAHQPDIFRHLAATADQALGVRAEVVQPGHISLGDPVRLLPDRF